jgi:hypothetical protein
MIRNINNITYNPPSSSGNNTATSVGTTETVLNSVLIPANTFKVLDVFGIQTRITKTSGTTTISLRLRIGPTLNNSQTLVGINTSTAGTHNYIPFDRRLSIQNITTNTKVLNVSDVRTTDLFADGASTSLTSSLSIDWTVDNYIIVTGQSTSGTNTLNCGYIFLDLIQQRI